MEAETRKACSECKVCRGECNFTEVIDLKGIKIYKHESSIDNINVESKCEKSISYILHNTRCRPIQSGDIQSPLEEATLSCPRCRAILQHAQKLLTRIPSIGRNVVIGICDHCQIQQSMIKACKKCARVIREFLDSRDEDYVLKEKTIMPWLSTIKKALQNELVNSAATATSHESRISRGERELLVGQRHGFDPAKAPRDGRVKLTCTPCESRSMEPINEFHEKPFIDLEFLKLKPAKSKPNFAEFARQHKVSIQESQADQAKEQAKWPLLYHSVDSVGPVATDNVTGEPRTKEECKSQIVRPPAPPRSSLKKPEKLRFLLQAREYHSGEYLNETKSAFQYIFPGDKQKGEPQTQISSSELIKKTLEQFEEKKAQHEERDHKELQSRKEKNLAADEERKRTQQLAKDEWETSSNTSRVEKFSLDRKGVLVKGYVGKFNKRVSEEKRDSSKPQRSADEIKSGISDKGTVVDSGAIVKLSKDERFEEEKEGKPDKKEKSGVRGKGGKTEKSIKDDMGSKTGGKESKDDKAGKPDSLDRGYKKGKHGKTDRIDKQEKGVKLEKGSKDIEKAEKRAKAETSGTDPKWSQSVAKIKDVTNEKVSKGDKDGTAGKGRVDEFSEKIGKARITGTMGKGNKDETSRIVAKGGKDETSQMVGNGYKDRISGMMGKKFKDEKNMGKGDKPEKSDKGPINSKKIKESPEEQVDVSKMPQKSKKKVSREESKPVVKEDETNNPLTKAEQERQKLLETEEKTVTTKRKQEYDKQVREMEKNIKAIAQDDDYSKFIQIEQKPVDKDKVAKLREETPQKKLTEKEAKQKSDLKKKEELEKKLKEYEDNKGVPLLRVVTANDKKAEGTDNELRLTKSQQLLLAKRQKEDLDLMRQLEERRRAKAHQIVIPATSPLTKKTKKPPSGTQILQVTHEDEGESEDEFEAYMDNFNRNAYKPPEIIFDTNIYKYTKETEAQLMAEEIAPCLFKIEAGANTSKDVTPDLVPVQSVEKSKPKARDGEDRKGITSYALSDRSFIEKGWTMLPTEKVMRKMNIYSMSPAQPQFDWFERNRNKGTIYYDSGEKLAEFEDNQTARWYYRNGRPALEYYEAEEVNARQRIVVYSNGEPDDRGRNYPITILATFDYLGNGIVFDHTGKIRLKYNQTEGVMLDRSLGPVTQWKWHALNDPPILQRVMINNQLPIKDETIMELGASDEEQVRPDNEQMLVIEYDNHIKEKTKKMTKKFQPFQIKMKAMKINENFSLRVLDQANVCLHFRDSTTTMKLNLGMKLNNKEIVDSDTVEVGLVAHPMQKFPAKSDSLARMQLCLSQNQQTERERIEHDLNIRPVMSVASVDRMYSAVSRKLRSPLPQGSSTRTETTTDASGNLRYHCRKPCACVFYANQLI